MGADTREATISQFPTWAELAKALREAEEEEQLVESTGNVEALCRAMEWTDALTTLAFRHGMTCNASGEWVY